MANILGNRYEIQKQLGKKAGRRTFLAKDLQTEELVIVKLLAFNSDFHWDDLKLFEREAQTLKSLSHPSIPRYLDYFEVTESNYQGFALVQTYIPAKTLEQYLQTGRNFTENEIKEIGKAVLEILIYLHELHPPVIHRDIKPSNILLGERSGNSVGKVYLVDFGSVQTVLATEGTGTRTIVGTYGYMPQEQFGGRTVPASDLYSLGATLIYLITGTQPADLPQKNFRIQFEQVANLSPSLTNWLKKMIEPDLEKRFASANAVLQSLEKPENSEITNLTIAKPAGSKIQLVKNDQKLEVMIPPLGYHEITICIGISLIPLNFILISALPAWQNALEFAGNRIPLTVWIFFLIGDLGLIGVIIYLFFGSYKISIDNLKISINHYLGKWRIPFKRSATRENIDRIIYTNKHFKIDNEGDKVEVKPKLVIWSGVEKFEITVDAYLIKSETELEWLADELSDWLGIEISYEQ